MLSKSSEIFKDVFFKFESCNFFKKIQFFSVYLRSCLFCNFFKAFVPISKIEIFQKSNLVLFKSQ